MSHPSKDDVPAWSSRHYGLCSAVIAAAQSYLLTNYVVMHIGDLALLLDVICVGGGYCWPFVEHSVQPGAVHHQVCVLQGFLEAHIHAPPCVYSVAGLLEAHMHAHTRCCI